MKKTIDAFETKTGYHRPDELVNLECTNCKEKNAIELLSTSVCQGGKGIYYSLCTVCGTEFNILWGNHKKYPL